MTPAQRARMMGPAQSVLVNAPGLGVLEAKRRADWPGPEKGPLTFNAEQMAEISAAMSHRSKRKLMAYLRETLPDKAAPMDDATLLAWVQRTQAEGRTWGLRTEAGLGRFLWLYYVTKGAFSQNEKIKNYVSENSHLSDQRLKEVIEQIIALRTQQEAAQ